MGLFSGLIGAGLSLIGGRKDRKAKERAADPALMRAQYEGAGFNAMLGLPGVNAARSQLGTSMGRAFSAAGNFLADAFSQREQVRIQKAQLEVENERLRQSAQRLTMHANVPGIYGRRSNGQDQGRVSTRNRPVSGVSANSDTVQSDVESVGSVLAGVKPEDAVNGTVPYVGMAGDVTPGPNPETQMGIDEVLGWVAMEGAAYTGRAYKWARDLGRRHALALDIAEQNRARAHMQFRRSQRVTRNPARDRFFFQQNPRRY